MKRKTSVVVGALILGAALGGCSQPDSERGFSGTRETSTTTTAVPADAGPAGGIDGSSGTLEPVSPPSRPQITQLDDREAAQAWLGYLAEALDDAYLTGDIAIVRTLTSPDCTRCLQELTALRDLHERGGRSSAPNVTYTVTGMDASSDDGTRRLEVTVSSDPVVQENSDGEAVRTDPGLTDERLEFELRPAGSRWLVSDLPVGQPGPAS